jgi:phosphoribosylformylglycinamidine cyclo-ligase
MAHITGGGLSNLSRINPAFDYEIEILPHYIPPVFGVLQERCQLDVRELYRTFNMGIGFVIATGQPEVVLDRLKARGEAATVIGRVRPGQGTVRWHDVVFT